MKNKTGDYIGIVDEGIGNAAKSPRILKASLITNKKASKQ